MDGLLVDSEPLWHRAEAEILGDLGVPIKREGTRSTKGMFVSEVMRYWFDRFPWIGPSPQEVSEMVVDRVGELTVAEGIILPGARATVQEMAERGPIALASSTPKRLIAIVLDHIGLTSEFSIICSAEDEDYGKPHPAVFLTAARTIGVDPTHCVVFEDAPAGVLAAKAARMVCVAVPEPSERDRAEIALADFVLETLEDLNNADLDVALQR